MESMFILLNEIRRFDDLGHHFQETVLDRCAVKETNILSSTKTREMVNTEMNTNEREIHHSPLFLLWKQWVYAAIDYEYTEE